MRIKILWGALGLLLLLLAFTTGTALFYRLLLGLIAVPVLGLFASILAARRIEGGVYRLTPYLQVGDNMEERITLQNTHWWPKLLLEVQHDTRPFGRIGRITTLWPLASVSWTTSKHCERRGIYRFGELEITSRDPFNLFSRTMRLGRQQTALIYPATVDLSGFFVPSGRGWTEGVIRGRTFTPSPIASGVREYTSRDAMSRIHWPVTAHTGKLMVKDFEHEPSGPADAVWVVLDLEESNQVGEGSESTVEYAVTTAASVAKRFLDTGRTVGAVLLGKERMIIQPSTGVAQLGRILQALALIEVGLGGVREAAEAVQNELSTGASIVLITSAKAEEVASAAEKVRAMGAAVVPVIIEPSSFASAPATQDVLHLLPGGDLSAYVVRMGDEIGNRLDYRSAGPGLVSPALDQVGRP